MCSHFDLFVEKIPYCVRFHPDKDKQHIVLAGCSDKRIVQFDTRSGKLVQVKRKKKKKEKKRKKKKGL